MLMESAWPGILGGILLGFLCGSLLPGYWIGKYAFGKDLQAEGSGNIGATNAFRILGTGVGSLVLCLDILKGVLAVWLSRKIQGPDMVSGLSAVLGHTFSPFLKFRGGKGVATGFGVFLMLIPKAALLAVGTFAIVFVLGRRVSPASCLAAIVLGAAVPILTRDILLILITEIVILVVLVKHRENVRRLVRGEEKALF